MKMFLFLTALLTAFALHAQPEAMETETNTAPAELTSTNSPADAPPDTNVITEINISSDHATLQTETNYTVLYSGNVRVTYGDAKLACDQLTIRSAKEAERPEYILADRNVVLDHKDKHGKPIHATGDRAVYFLDASSGTTNEVITLTGDAKVQTTRANFAGEIVTINLTTGEIRSPARQQTVIKLEGDPSDRLPYNTTRTNAP